jgi:hypothetical protein
MPDRELTTLARHARTMATRPETPPAERRLWRQIADEIDTYLAGELGEHITATPDQLTLGPAP